MVFIKSLLFQALSGKFIKFSRFVKSPLQFAKNGFCKDANLEIYSAIFEYRPVLKLLIFVNLHGEFSNPTILQSPNPPISADCVFSRLKDWFGHETIINMKEQQTIRVIE